VQFVELLLGDGGGRVHHEVAAGVVLGEGDHVADGVVAAEDADPAVEAEGRAGVRGGAIAEGVHEEAELLLRLLVAESQHLEHFGLKFGIEDAH